MTQHGGASVNAGVAAGVAGDTCDTSAPGAPVLAERVTREPEAPVIEGSSVTRPRAAKRTSPGSRTGPRALLDHLPSPLSPRSTVDCDPGVGAFERRARVELLASIHPALEAARSTRLPLFSLTLTAPHVDMFRETVRDFAHGVVDDPLEGVLLALEPGENHGRPHYHGLALVSDVVILSEHWAEFAGREAEPPRATPVSRWWDFCGMPYERDFGENIFRIVQYASKPWPPGRGARSLADYIASGSFAAPLRVFQDRMRAPMLSEAKGLGMPAHASPTCRLCGGPLPVGCRSDMRRHRRCRSRASKEKRRAERAAELLTAGRSTPDDTEPTT